MELEGKSHCLELEGLPSWASRDMGPEREHYTSDKKFPYSGGSEKHLFSPCNIWHSTLKRGYVFIKPMWIDLKSSKSQDGSSPGSLILKRLHETHYSTPILSHPPLVVTKEHLNYKGKDTSR